MKHDHLARAPVIEALLEIQVPLGVDYTFVPGALAERLRNQFPDSERVNTFQIGNFTVPTLLAPNATDVRLRSRDGRFVQLGPQVITINMLAPYPGFNVFEETMSSALEVFYQIARPLQPRRMSLRYLNLITPQILAESAVNVDAKFPSTVLPEKKAFTMRAVFPFSSPDGELAIAASLPHTLSTGKTGFLLDLDFYKENPDAGSPGEIVTWANKAHDRIYDAFEACVGKTMMAKFR